MRQHDSIGSSDSPSNSQSDTTPTDQEDHYAGAHTKEDFLAVWDELTAEEKLAVILSQWTKDQWWDIETLRILALFFNRKPLWGSIKNRAKEAGVNEFDLHNAVKEIWEELSTMAATGNGKAGLNMVVTADVTETDVQWLWWPYLPLGHLAMLDGEPGVGKSLLSLLLAAVLSRGWNLPDQNGKLTMPTGDPSYTLILSVEDSLSSTIVPRLTKCKADCHKVIAVTGWHNETTKPGEQEFFTFEQLQLLEEGLQKYHPRLVVIDPIQAYLGGKVDINRANETRPLLSALAKYAEHYQCAIVIVRHPAKSGQGSAIHRGLGSIDFIGAARSALFVTQHPIHADQALLCHTKNNLGPLGRTQIFTKGEDGFHWKNVTRLDAETLVGVKRGPDPFAFIEACLWLEQRLSGGLAWPCSDIETEADQEGHAKRTLHRAKKAVGVLSFKEVDKQTKVERWMWRLKPLSTISPPTTYIGSLDSLDSLGSLGSLGNLKQNSGGNETTTQEPTQDTPPCIENQENQESQDCQVSQVIPPRAREISREEIESALAAPTLDDDGHEILDDAAEEECADLMPSSLCPELGRHNLIKGAKGWECTRCHTPFKTHPGCHTLGLEHTLAIRDGHARTKERHCTICGTVTEAWEQ